MQGQREILLVEDEDADADLASRAFRRAETANSLVRVRDGVEALDYLFARGKFASGDVHDLPMFILLDLNIPKVSGTSVLARCQIPAPVIIFSSSTNPTEIDRCLELGAREFVQKPSDLGEFEKAVSRIVRNWLPSRPAPATSVS